LSRTIPVAVSSTIGGAIGGAPGAVVGGTVGGVLAASMGAPGTALANMVKSPRFRYAVGDKAAAAMESAAARGPAALASMYYTLANKDPEFRKAAEQAQKELREAQSEPTAAP